MNLFQLNLFVNTIHSGSMKVAADNFYISQSALSQNIKKLESELGCTLIDRTHSPLKPTLYGKIVLDRAERILFLANEIEEEIARRKRIDAQTIMVGSFYPTLANSEMVYVANAHPDLNFQVVIDDEPALLSDLIKGAFDFVFLSKPRSIPGFESFELTREQLFVSLPNNSPLSDKESIACDEITDLRVTVPSDLDGVSSWYHEFLDEIDMKQENVNELSSEEYFAAMVNPDVIHFRSSLMTAPLNMLSKKRHLPLVEPEIWRSILVMYPTVKAKKLEPLLKTLKKGAQTASAISIIPKLLQFSASSNLVIKKSVEKSDE
ncbi:hypothetical protein C1878_12870 [Gordonibacter sp. 28C]|uniref:LysR family transcriptional regulator n=1 Tax=Gordonibacter sp. 28C TaxID=2078569 RepID=UPI000DF7BA74|nr:LysR family transcriptional regulator [Gordonibacter sp. 28C]RDB60932.1 hypothetical protein C1878_12870 [Gordonibacter sp. 28C]